MLTPPYTPEEAAAIVGPQSGKHNLGITVPVSTEMVAELIQHLDETGQYYQVSVVRGLALLAGL